MITEFKKVSRHPIKLSFGLALPIEEFLLFVSFLIRLEPLTSSIHRRSRTRIPAHRFFKNGPFRAFLASHVILRCSGAQNTISKRSRFLIVFDPTYLTDER